jgi:hypothetical protein
VTAPGYVTVSVYLHIEPIWDDYEVIGAKVVGFTQKKPKHARAVRVTMQVPVVAFEPLVAPDLKLPYDAQLVDVGVEDD